MTLIERGAAYDGKDIMCVVVEPTNQSMHRAAVHCGLCEAAYAVGSMKSSKLNVASWCDLLVLQRIILLNEGDMFFKVQTHPSLKDKHNEVGPGVKGYDTRNRTNTRIPAYAILLSTAIAVAHNLLYVCKEEIIRITG
jgi:hypothetical protein